MAKNAMQKEPTALRRNSKVLGKIDLESRLKPKTKDAQPKEETVLWNRQPRKLKPQLEPQPEPN